MACAVVWRKLLVLLWLQPILVVSAPQELCKSLNTLRSSLTSTQRRSFMKHNFPVNYTIRIHPQEVFRLHNIDKLKVAHVELQDLQDLWLLVNQEILKKILKVLPKRHPSHRYVSDLENLFRMVQQVQMASPGVQEEREPPEKIQKIWVKLKKSDSRVWKWVTPKSLLDSCFRTMHCLFADCFPEQQYCSLLHWKREQKQSTHS